VKRYLLALAMLIVACDGPDSSSASESSEQSCSDVRLAILEECEELYDARVACDMELATLKAGTSPWQNKWEECSQRAEDQNWCERSLGGDDVTNATGEFTAAEVVAYCDHESPSGDRWCPEAEMGCEL
jgi:hypothetical protein